ncbi:MAG: hypothetical protein ABIG90_02185 [bacterium]
MLKFPCPIEQDLDKIKRKMWIKSGRNIDRLVEDIKHTSDKTLKKHGYYIKPTGPNIGLILRDKSKSNYKA